MKYLYMTYETLSKILFPLIFIINGLVLKTLKKKSRMFCTTKNRCRTIK